MILKEKSKMHKIYTRGKTVCLCLMNTDCVRRMCHICAWETATKTPINMALGLVFKWILHTVLQVHPKVKSILVYCPTQQVCCTGLYNMNNLNYANVYTLTLWFRLTGKKKLQGKGSFFKKLYRYAISIVAINRKSWFVIL